MAKKRTVKVDMTSQEARKLRSAFEHTGEQAAVLKEALRRLHEGLLKAVEQGKSVLNPVQIWEMKVKEGEAELKRAEKAHEEALADLGTIPSTLPDAFAEAEALFAEAKAQTAEVRGEAS